MGCLLQSVVSLCQIYFYFILQTSRMNVEALVSSALLHCSVLHVAANWHCRQIHFPFLYFAVILFICLFDVFSPFLLLAFLRLWRLTYFDKNT